MSHVTRIQNELAARNLDAMLINSEANQKYASAFNYTDGYLFITRGKAYLVTDFRYEEAATKAVNPDEIEVCVPSVSMLAFISEIITKESIASVAFEGDVTSYNLYTKLQDLFPKGVTLHPVASEILDALRIHKTEEELACIAEAQAIADLAFAHILKIMTPSMTEIDVALELEFFMRAHGAEGIAFETIAVSGDASSLPHGVPRNEKLKPGFLTMDYGAKVDGYCSDMTRTVVIGKADAEMKRLYNTVLEAQLAALEAAAPGMACSAVDKIARDIIDNAGYKGCFGHSLGHGVGLYIHEAPRLASSAPATSLLEPGHVVTFEPGIYLAGQYGCRIEDMAAITEDGIRNFTKSPKELIELF